MAFYSWLLYATRIRTAPPAGRPARLWLPRLRTLNLLYDVHGAVRLREREIPWLEGYAGSRPVRLGNAASGQLQLDVFGEVVLAAYEFVERGGTLDAAEGRLLRQLGETVRRLWREPDEGIWEKRAGALPSHLFEGDVLGRPGPPAAAPSARLLRDAGGRLRPRPRRVASLHRNQGLQPAAQ